MGSSRVKISGATQALYRNKHAVWFPRQKKKLRKETNIMLADICYTLSSTTCCSYKSFENCIDCMQWKSPSHFYCFPSELELQLRPLSAPFNQDQYGRKTRRNFKGIKLIVQYGSTLFTLVYVERWLQRISVVLFTVWAPGTHAVGLNCLKYRENKDATWHERTITIVCFQSVWVCWWTRAQANLENYRRLSYRQ